MKYNKGFAPILILVIVLGVLAVGGVAYFAGKSSAPKNEVSDNSNIAKPSITILSPKGGESYTNIIPVRWTSQNIQGNVNIQFYFASKLLFTVPSVQNTGSKDINLANYYTQSSSANAVYVKICDTTDVCNMNNQPFAFTFTITPKVISPVNTTTSKPLGFIENSVGQSFTSLFSNQTISTRFTNVLGVQGFAELKANWQVQTSIEKEANIYSAWGCKQHACPSYSATVYFDVASDNINISIFKDKDSYYHLYTEKGTIILPANMQKNLDIQKQNNGN